MNITGGFVLQSHSLVRTYLIVSRNNVVDTRDVSHDVHADGCPDVSPTLTATTMLTGATILPRFTNSRVERNQFEQPIGSRRNVPTDTIARRELLLFAVSSGI